MQTGRLQSWLQEPLLLFGILGAGVFVLHELRAAPTDAMAEDSAVGLAGPVLLTDEVISSLTDDYRWLYGRAPEASELQSLVDRWLEEERLFREALRVGLHRSDSKTRQRLADMLRQFWAIAPGTPTESQLRAFHAAQSERYRSERAVSFEQIFFEGKPPPSTFAQLNAGAQLEGDPFWLGRRLDAYGESVLRSNFGGNFFELLWQAPLDQWIGPLPSPRGAHFVRVFARQPMVPLAYEAVAATVLADWQAEQSQLALNERLKPLALRYPLVDRRQPSAAPP